MSTDQILDRLVALQRERAQHKPGAREAMLIEARKLVSDIEIPCEFIYRNFWTEMYCAVILRVAVDLKLLDTLAAAHPTPVSTEDLAKKSGAEKGLIERMMRHLAGSYIVAEPSENHFAANNLTLALTEERYRSAVTMNVDLTYPSIMAIPKFLKETSYVDPTDMTMAPFQHAFNTKLQWFPWLVENPAHLKPFQSYMEAVRDGKMTWMDPGFFPVDEKLKPSGEADEVVFVDVGGGQGANVMDLVKRHPQLAGKVVLQDKPEVIEYTKPKLTSGVTAMTHDFLTEQPIKGARAYYMHLITHDWDDEHCVKIFKQLRPAMVPGKSMLLINDLIVPDKGAGWSVTSMDWCMLTFFCARERTEAHFRKLLQEAGFKVDKIWTIEQGTESVIEASVA